VYEVLREQWATLREGRVMALPQPPPLPLLRTPQLDQLPRGWVWRRQVRTRRGLYFGTQDLLFYRDWKDARDNCGRHRSYKEIANTLHRL